MDIKLLIILWAGHYLADFSLQTQFMSQTKGKIFIEPIGFHTLTGHAFVQGLVIGLLAQNYGAGLAVGVTHWIIDFFRSSERIIEFLIKKKVLKQSKDKLFGIHIDQLLHLSVILLVVWRLS